MNIKYMIFLLQSSKGFTQAQIAAELGCRQSNISYLLNNRGHMRRRERPSHKIVEGLNRMVAKYGLAEIDQQKLSIN